MEIWSLEACCRRSDVGEVQRFEALEMRCIRTDIEVWRSGALEARCRRCLFVSRAPAHCLLLLEFWNFVPQGTSGKLLWPAEKNFQRETAGRNPVHPTTAIASCN